MRIRLTEKQLRALAPRIRGYTMASKYHNKKTVVDGFTFDSKAESERYRDLCVLEFRGLICGYDWKLRGDVRLSEARQQRIPLIVNGVKVASYVADFVYRDLATGDVVVEDYKGFKTETYKLKAKLFAACLGFPITEIRRARNKAIA